MSGDTELSTEPPRDKGVPPPELSVVVVTYNEQERVRSCLDSVFRACEDLPTFEVVLVDSNSTDRTVEIASEFPITILQIPDDDLTTPAAGRYVGTEAARADRILFVDGDMVVRKEWLMEALSYLQDHPGVAGVDGELNEPGSSDDPSPIDAIRGVALYDADALAAVGGFDPYLRSLEDVYLGFELVTAGYDLYRLPSVAADHPDRSPTDPIRRWHRGYMHGTGQALRKSLRRPRVLRKVVGRLRYKLFLSAWLLVGAISVLSVPLLALWLASSALGVTIVASRLGVGGTAYFFFAKFVGMLGLFRGLSLAPRDPERFPLGAVLTVQRGPLQHGTAAVRESAD